MFSPPNQIIPFFPPSRRANSWCRHQISSQGLEEKNFSISEQLCQHLLFVLNSVQTNIIKGCTSTLTGLICVLFPRLSLDAWESDTYHPLSCNDNQPLDRTPRLSISRESHPVRTTPLYGLGESRTNKIEM